MGGLILPAGVRQKLNVNDLWTVAQRAQEHLQAKVSNPDLRVRVTGHGDSLQWAVIYKPENGDVQTVYTEWVTGPELDLNKVAEHIWLSDKRYHPDPLKEMLDQVEASEDAAADDAAEIVTEGNFEAARAIRKLDVLA